MWLYFLLNITHTHNWIHYVPSQSWPTLCNPMDCSPPGSSIHGTSNWSGLPYPSPGDLSEPEIKLTSPVSPALAGRFFTTAPPGNPGSYIVRGCLPLKIWKRDIRRCKLCIRTIFSFCDSQFQNIYIETEALWGFHQCHEATAAAAKSLQSCPTLCDPIDGSPPGSPIPRILQARTLEWVAISFSNAWKWKVKVKSCPTLSDPMDRSLAGSSWGHLNCHGWVSGKQNRLLVRCCNNYTFRIRKNWKQTGLHKK